jgi:hypothetical protein
LSLTTSFLPFISQQIISQAHFRGCNQVNALVLSSTTCPGIAARKQETLSVQLSQS